MHLDAWAIRLATFLLVLFLFFFFLRNLLLPFIGLKRKRVYIKLAKRFNSDKILVGMLLEKDSVVHHAPRCNAAAARNDPLFSMWCGNNCYVVLYDAYGMTYDILDVHGSHVSDQNAAAARNDPLVSMWCSNNCYVVLYYAYGMTYDILVACE